MDDACQTLLGDIARLYDNDLGSDVKIRCGSRTFKAHKPILSIRSSVLRAALANDRWEEGHRGEIVISDQAASDEQEGDASDDPVAVAMMLQFIYRGDYEAGRDPYQTSDLNHGKLEDTEAEVSDDREGSLDEAPDVEASSVAAANEDNSSDEQEVGVESDPCLETMSCGLLMLHARVYSLGDKYDIQSLKMKAQEKFEQDAERLDWNDESFCAASTAVFNSTSSQDAGLRDVVIGILDHRATLDHITEEVDQHICTTPGLAAGLWKRRVKGSPGPQCNQCGTVEVRKCVMSQPGAWNFASNCEEHFAECRCRPDIEVCPSCIKSNAAGAKKKKKKRPMVFGDQA